MPAHVQDLLVEVDLVGIGFFPHSAALAGGAGGGTSCSGASFFGSVGRGTVDGGGHADLFGFESGLIGLEYDFCFDLRIGGVDHEVVVVRAGHDIAAIAAEDHFEFVEDTVVLVGITQTWPKMFVDGYCLHRLSLHVDIPDLDGEVVAGEDVTTIVGEADIGDGGDDFGKEGAGGGVLLLFKFCKQSA